MSSTTPKPTFLMIGGQRCGSTWVDRALRGHPEIFLPATKQSYFFDITYDRGIDWYLERFAGAVGAKKTIGEVATGYCLPHAVPRMAHHLPEAKLIMSMRHPVERAWSYFQSRSVKHGWRRFEDAVAAEPDILARGHYADQIEAVLGHYARDRLLLLDFADLARDDRRYLREILTFIGVDPEYQSPQSGRVVQTSAFPQLRRTLRRLGLGAVVELVAESPLDGPIRRYLGKSAKRRYAPMPDSLRAELLAHYAPHNRRLATLTGWDLSPWER